MQPQHRDRAGFKVERFSAAELLMIVRLFRVACIDQHFPSNAVLMRGQDKGKWFMIGIEQQ